MTFYKYLTLALLFISLSTFSQQENKNKLFAKKAKVKMIKTGFAFTEGPAVHKNGSVFFTDQPNDKIHIWDEKKGFSVYLDSSRRSNGLYFNAKQQLVACADEKNQLVYFNDEKKPVVIQENFEGKHLNAPNDLWIAPNGSIYFTDPYYHRSWWNANHKEIQDTRGVYHVNTNGEMKRVVNDFKKPNGIIGTPDGKTLYVADIEDQKIWKYDITSNGSLTNKTFFAPHGSDGMTIDNKGNIYLTFGKIWVYNKKGVLIKEIEIPEKPANVCFGGKKRNILFITARKSIYTLKTKVKGVN